MVSAGCFFYNSNFANRPLIPLITKPLIHQNQSFMCWIGQQLGKRDVLPFLDSNRVIFPLFNLVYLWLKVSLVGSIYKPLLTVKNK